MKRYSGATRGYVYFLSCPGADSIKIGFSESIEKRLLQIENYSPLPTKLIKWVRASYSMEHVLLLLFEEHRTKNEWFAAAPELVEFIDSLLHTEELTMSVLVKKLIAK